MGHGVSLQEAPAEPTEPVKPGDDQPKKEAFTERPPSANSTKNAKAKEDGNRKQSKGDILIDKDKDKENVLRARVMSIASVTLKGPGKLRLRRQSSKNMVTPIAAIHSNGSPPHSESNSRQSSAKHQNQQPLFSRRKESMAPPPNGDSSRRASRSSSATSVRGGDDNNNNADRPPSGRCTPKLSRPRSRRHSRTAVTPVDSPTQRSPERDANAVANFATSPPPRPQEVTTVEDFD